MADITTSASVQRADATSLIDPIQLHAHALNSLARCRAMLTANEPMYLYAEQYLAEAQQAVAALSAIDTSIAI